MAHSWRGASGAGTLELTTGTDSPRFPSRCCSISRRFPTTKIHQFFGDFFAATIPRPRLKRTPCLTAWFAMRSPIFAILSLRRSATERPTKSKAACLGRFHRRLSQLPQDRQRGRNPARALRYRPTDPAIPGPLRKGLDRRAPRSFERVFQYDLRCPSGRESWAALRIIHCDLWDR